MKPSIFIWHCEYDMVFALIPQCMDDECKLSLSPECNIDLNENEEDKCQLNLSLEWNTDFLTIHKYKVFALIQLLIFHNYFNSRLSIFSVHTGLIKMLLLLKCFCTLKLRRGTTHPKCAWHNSNRDSEHHRKKAIKAVVLEKQYDIIKVSIQLQSTVSPDSLRKNLCLIEFNLGLSEGVTGFWR